MWWILPSHQNTLDIRAQIDWSWYDMDLSRIRWFQKATSLGKISVNFHEYSPWSSPHRFSEIWWDWKGTIRLPFWDSARQIFTGRIWLLARISPWTCQVAEFFWVDKQRGEQNPRKPRKTWKFSPFFFGPKKCCLVFAHSGSPTWPFFMV